ncbi:hypothetical protein Tco_0533397 [Tanacetum coccineum]
MWWEEVVMTSAVVAAVVVAVVWQRWRWCDAAMVVVAWCDDDEGEVDDGDDVGCDVMMCVFNANHEACITKLLKEVNSRAKIQPHRTSNSNKPIEPMSHTQKPGRQIVIGNRFSPIKSSVVLEKTNTPRSCLRWIPTDRIFNTVGLRWVPTGKKLTSSTTKVDYEPPNGSNEDITNPYKCDQTLNVSAGTLNLSTDNTSGPVPQRKERYMLQCALSLKEEKSSCL